MDWKHWTACGWRDTVVEDYQGPALCSKAGVLTQFGRIVQGFRPLIWGWKSVWFGAPVLPWCSWETYSQRSAFDIVYPEVLQQFSLPRTQMHIIAQLFQHNAVFRQTMIFLNRQHPSRDNASACARQDQIRQILNYGFFGINSYIVTCRADSRIQM